MRRSHKKTRTGCRTCKRRKIKCDEQWPVCRRCRDRNLECELSIPTHPLARSMLVIDPPELRILDLELIHHFTSSTYATLTKDPVIRDLWRTGIIRLALSCDYVMLSILSVSALHMKHLNPSRSEEMHSQAVSYHEQASRLAIGVMGDQEKDAGEKFLFSVLTVYYALGSQPGTDTVDGSVYPLWMTLIQGCKAFLMTSADDIKSGCLSAMLAHAGSRLQVRTSITPNDYLHELRALVQDSVTDHDRLTTYLAVIDELDGSLTVAYQTPGLFDLVDVFVWIVFAQDLIPLLKRQEKEALAILAHFCLLLNRLSHRWWLGDWVVQLMEGITNNIGERHRHWIRWPLEEISGGKTRSGPEAGSAARAEV